MTLHTTHKAAGKLALLNSLFKSNRYFDDNDCHDLIPLSGTIIPDVQQLNAFNQVVGWQNHQVLAPTWLQVAAMPLYMGIITASGFPYSPLGLVHVENRISVLKPLNCNEQYDVSCRAQNFRAHRKGQLFDLVVKADVAGELVYEAVAANLAFLKQTQTVAKEAFSETTPLQKEVLSFLLASDIGRQYAAVSRDYNLIHLAAIPAKLFGFKRHIAHGMYLKARTLSAFALSGDLADEKIEVGIKFMKPVFLPGKVRVFSHLNNSGKEPLSYSIESGNRDIVHAKGHIKAL